MSGVNKVIIMGRLGQSPESKYLPNGGMVTNLSIATSETWKDKQSGEKREKTEWHRCVAFRKPAEILAKHLSKGDMIYIEGKLQTRSWEDKDGNKRYTTEIVVDQFSFIGGGNGGSGKKGGSGNGGGKPQFDDAPDYSADDADFASDDIPF